MKYYITSLDKITEADSASALPYSSPVPLDDKPPSTHINQSFSTSNPNLQLAWDSVSLGHLKTCPYKYKLSVIEGWTFRVKPVKMAFGIAFHKLVETWDILLTTGLPKETCLKRIVRLAGLLGERLPPGPNTHTKETLIRAITLYLLHFWDDPAVPIPLADGKPAVEVDIRYPFTVINDKQFYIIVHIDSIVSFRGDLYFKDVKTTGGYLNDQFFSKFEIDNQMRLYDLSANVFIDQPLSGGIIDAVRTQVNGVNLQRYPFEIHPSRRQEFIDDLESWLRLATFYAENNLYPQNETACTHYGGCQFLNVCKKPPHQREHFLRTEFVRKTWDPVEPRE
jgi:hypothetical protein